MAERTKTWLITGCSEGGIGAGIARAVLGSDAVKIVRAALEGRLQELDHWADVSARTDF